MSDGPQAKATNGRTTRKKRFFHLAPEPKDKRPRPENPSLGPSQDGCKRRLECLGQLDTLVLALVEPPSNLPLQELWLGVQAAGEHFSAETAAKVLQRLPELLAASALKALDLSAHLEKGAAVEAAALPTQKSSEENTVNEAFLILHAKVEANLDAAMQALIPLPSLEWLSTVAMFYGSLRPAPLPRHILEDCADLAFKQRKDEPKECCPDWPHSWLRSEKPWSGMRAKRRSAESPTDLHVGLVQRISDASPELLKGIAGALKCAELSDREQTQLLRGLADAALWSHCLEHLQGIRSTGLQCNVVHVNAVAAAKVDRSWPVMMKLLEATKTWRGLQLDTISFNTAAGSCIGSGEWTHALHWMTLLVSGGLKGDPTSHNIALALFDKLGRWHMVLHTFDESQADVASYSMIMRNAQLEGSWQLAIALLDKILDAKLRLDNTAMNTAVACIPRWEIATEVLLSMSSRSMPKDGNRHDKRRDKHRDNRRDKRCDNRRDKRCDNRRDNRRDKRCDNRRDKRCDNCRDNRRDKRYDNRRDTCRDKRRNKRCDTCRDKRQAL
eukprot:s565_g14.t1